MSITGKIFNTVFLKRINNVATDLATAAISKISAQMGGGRYGGFGRSGGAKWPFGMSNSGSATAIDHARTRANARTAYQESPQVKALIDRYADTVADIGLVVEPTPNSDILGITPEKAEDWALDVSQKFDMWARSKKQHRARQMNFYQSQRLFQICQHRDGEVFPRLYYSADASLINPLQFEFIDPSQIRGDAYTYSFGPICGDDGIERNSQGVEIGYKIWIKDKREFKPVTIPAVGSKSKRTFMLHAFAPEYPGQKRGYSRLSHALQDFENLTDFTSAQIKKAIAQSNISFFVKPSADAPASNPFKDLLKKSGAGPAAQQFGTNPTPSDSAVKVNYSPLPEVTMDTPGSAGVFNLEGGEDLKSLDQTAPGPSFDKFVDTFCSHLAASHSMPLEVLLMKFNQNYSASRGALILFWRVALIWREEMATDYLNPVYEMWLAGEIAAGRIVAPGWSDPRLKAAWLNNKWIGSPMPNIDPAKTAKADQMYVELGAHTLERVSRNHNGSSYKSNSQKLKRELANNTIPPWGKNFNKKRNQNL